MEPKDNLINIVKQNPELFLSDDVLDSFLINLSFLDFITIISNFPDLYDKLEEKQGFWKVYYLQRYPHVNQEELITNSITRNIN